MPEISANFKPAPDPALARLKVDSPSPSSPDPSHIHLSPATPHSPDTSPLIPDALCSDAPESSPDRGGGHSESVTGEGRLEDFLETSTGTPLLGGEPGGPLPLIDDLHSQMLSTPSILQPSPSRSPSPMPMEAYELGYSAPPTTGLDFADAALDTMDWLDITMGDGRGGATSPAHTTSLAVAPAAPPLPTSIFSADFLDTSDLQLHWDACL